MKVQLELHAGWFVFEWVICDSWLVLFFCMLVEGVLLGFVTER